MPRLRFPHVLALAWLAPAGLAIIPIGASLAFPARAGAAPLTLTLDPQATRITFGFGATLHSIEGKLRMREGRVDFDTASPAASGRIVVDMTSASTGVGRRDRKMHEKVLESARYPQAVFHVERVTGEFRPDGTSDVLLHGTLDFHGGRHVIDLPATARTTGDRVTASGRLAIPYVEWGLKDPSFFLLRVGKEVEVRVDAVGRLSSR